MENISSTIKIRFNTEKEKTDPGLPPWRVLIDGTEYLAENLEINTPVFTTEDNLQNGQKKWHISCHGIPIWHGKNCRIEAPILNGVIWLTGLPCAGKTTLGKELLSIALEHKLKCEYLDGDDIRTLFPSTGFGKNDRDNHIRRVGHMASLLERHNAMVVVSLVSPIRTSRDFARNLCKNFFEVYVSTPIEVCEERDTKGHFKKARNGEIKDFTGIDQAYEEPINPEMKLRSDSAKPRELALQIWNQYLSFMNVRTNKL
jgi:adenylylsulfate kinase